MLGKEASCLYTTKCNTEDTDTPTEGVQLERKYQKTHIHSH
jgi:hypothetical protein